MTPTVTAADFSTWDHRELPGPAQATARLRRLFQTLTSKRKAAIPGNNSAPDALLPCQSSTFIVETIRWMLMRFLPFTFFLESTTSRPSPRTHPGRFQRIGQRPRRWTRSQLKSPDWQIPIPWPSSRKSPPRPILRECSLEDATPSSCEQWLPTSEKRQL
jgi:hypothetical protein